MGSTKLTGVILTIKKSFSRTQKIEAFPTNYGITDVNNKILYYMFADKNGVELSKTDSKQINNFLLNQRMLKKF